MRIAIISDVHGNAYALDKALADISRQSVEQMVCLGDAIQGGPQPAEVVARLREIGCPVVMGNADSWLLTGIETDDEPSSGERKIKLEAVREWSLSRLTQDDRDFIAAFQPTVTIPLPTSRKLLCFHGSPTSFDEIILPIMPEAEFQAIFAPYLPSLVTGGHTHLQQIRPIGTTDAFFFNPGSIGFAYGHGQAEGTFYANAWAEYAILSVDESVISLEFRRVAYDDTVLIDIYRSSGRPYADEAIAQYQRA